MAYIYLQSFPTRWRYRLPPPSPFPYSHSPIYPNNKGASTPVAQRLGWGRTQCDPLLGRGPLKNTYGGPFHTPGQNTYGRAPSLPYPKTPLTLRSPKSNYGQLTSKGPTWGFFLHLPFWAHGQVTPIPKKCGGTILGYPILGTTGSLALFSVLDS